MKLKTNKVNAENFNETQIEKLPNDWCIEPVVKCLSKNRIKVGKVKKREYKELGKFPIVDQGQNLVAGYWDEEDAVYKGDLPVIIFGDHTRIVKFINFPFVCGADGTKVLITDKQKADALFLYYTLLYLDIPSRGYNRHYSLLKDKKIALPEISEQQQIAYVLSTIQNSKEQTENSINAFKELKKSLMKHLFKYGPISIEETEKVKLKETEVGAISEDWKISKIGELVQKTKQKDMRKIDVEFKYIDVSGVNRASLKVTDFNIYKGKSAPSRARKFVSKNDVIIATVRPTLKRIAVIGDEFDNQICSTAFCVLRVVEDKLDYSYLYYAVQRDEFIDILGKIQRGASYPAVTDSDIKSQAVPLPALHIQKKIALILSAVDNKIEKLENKRNALDELFKSMLQDLMTAKKRVNHLEVENG